MMDESSFDLVCCVLLLMLLPPSLLPVEAAEAERGTPSAATSASEPSPKPRYGLLARLLLAVPVLFLLLPDNYHNEIL